MSASALVGQTTWATRWAMPHGPFGNIVMLVFLCVQALDGVLTYLGVHVWGLTIEANPLVSSAVSLAGVGTGLAATKLVAVGLGIVLHLRCVHAAIAGLSAFYIAVAIVPWTVMFMTLP